MRNSNLDSDNAYSTTYPLISKDRDESSSSTIKASNDQIATSSSTLDKQKQQQQLKCSGVTTKTST